MPKMNRSQFKAGMYLLETLTSGMYNNPLSIYREYIQNAVDSIDLSKSQDKKNSPSISINLDYLNRTIVIRDNGMGIPKELAQDVLSTIGNSNKRGNGLRGFRGIGRLGGIAFSDKAIFRTKAEGEKIESIQEWNCKQLRELLNIEKSPLTFKALFHRTTTFSTRNNLPSKNSYFEVTLSGVTSFRNYVFDIAKVRDYISQVAPVPFGYAGFKYGSSIDDYLNNNLSHHGIYQITLNGRPIYKPYCDVIKTAMKKGGVDHIEGVHFFKIDSGNGKPVAHGWLGTRRDLLGSIRRGESYSGVRIRVGNILLGDAHLLDKCFREDRFNSYLIGEVHVDSPDLIPNSRRDDFIDNETKTLFYNAIEREIGLPISREIRMRSRISSENANSFSALKKEDSIIKAMEYIKTKKENLREIQFDSLIKDKISADVLNEILECCKSCPKLSIILNKIS